MSFLLSRDHRTTKGKMCTRGRTIVQTSVHVWKFFNASWNKVGQTSELNQQFYLQRNSESTQRWGTVFESGTRIGPVIDNCRYPKLHHKMAELYAIKPSANGWHFCFSKDVDDQNLPDYMLTNTAVFFFYSQQKQPDVTNVTHLWRCYACSWP